MANSFDPGGRGWSQRRLLFGGVLVLVVAALITAVLLAKSEGYLDRRVQVTAALANIGDGLPERADVKFRGVLVGAVTAVEPAENGRPNIVHIDLKADAASEIPSAVTARVVPSNVFAVSSVQLVDHGSAGRLRNGSVIAEDTELPPALFQTTAERVRQILASVELKRGEPPMGLAELVAKSTKARGDKLLSSGARLERILTEMNRLVSASPDDPSTISVLDELSRALSTTAPETLEALQNAVVPMRTIAEKQADLNSLLAGGLHTSGTASAALDNHIDQLVGITTNLEPLVGVLAKNQDKFLPIATRLNRLTDAVLSQAWDPGRQLFRGNVVVSFTPVWTYIRSDCPRYGVLEGPSCHTAPEVRKWFDIPQTLLPGSYRPPPDLAPPPGTPPPGPNTAPAAYGGNVGPVGSADERRALSAVLGGDVSSAQQLLLGPLARGTTVTISPDPGETGGR